MHESNITCRETYRLSNGVDMPMIGIGTKDITTIKRLKQVLLAAYRSDCRLIDTAPWYANEKALGKALKQTSLKREEFFITGKTRGGDLGYEKTLESFERSCESLGTDYLDLLLLNTSGERLMRSWMALERLYAEGKVRAIGVSEFSIEDLSILVQSNHIKPMIYQGEFNPHRPQEELMRFCKRHAVALSAGAPFDHGSALEDEICQLIADDHGRTPAQVILRWLYQMGVISLSKSSDPDRVAENLSIFDFSLDHSDLQKITHR